MKVLPAGLQDHLDSGATTLCWAWKLTRRDGVVMGFTDHDQPLSFGGVTLEAASGFTATEIQSSLGLSVDNLDVEGALSSEAIREADIAAGLYDDAGVEIWRVNWQVPEQAVLMRKGNLGEISRGDIAFRAEVRGLAHRLQQPQGRLYQYSCDTDVGDARCGVDIEAAAFNGTGTVSATKGRLALTADGLAAFADRWFDRGRLQFVTGNNAGLAFEVQAHRTTSGVVTLALWSAPPHLVTPGDVFSVLAGCDKRAETCRVKFANILNFRGFPAMPGNDYVVSYPNQGDQSLDGNGRYGGY